MDWKGLDNPNFGGNLPQPLFFPWKKRRRNHRTGGTSCFKGTSGGDGIVTKLTMNQQKLGSKWVENYFLDWKLGGQAVHLCFFMLFWQVTVHFFRSIHYRYILKCSWHLAWLVEIYQSIWHRWIVELRQEFSSAAEWEAKLWTGGLFSDV